MNSVADELELLQQELAQKELLRDLDALERRPLRDFSQSTADTVIEGVLATPRTTGNLLAFGAAGVRGLGDLLTGDDFDFSGKFAEEQQKFPASALRAIPTPTQNEVTAFLGSLPALTPGGETFSGRFDEILAREADIDAAREGTTADFLGELAGEGVLLTLGRAPIARGVNRLETAFDPQHIDMLFGAAARVRQASPGVRRTLDRVWRSPALRRLLRGTGRATETGFEAALLDMIKDDDPLETAAFAAGGQVLGSAALEGTKGLLSGGPTRVGIKIAAAAVATASIWQLVKDATPGGQDSVIDSVATGYEKVLLGLGAGAAAGMIGAGRGRGTQLAEDFPRLMDAIATLPRGTMIATLERLVDKPPEEQAAFETSLNQLITEPDSVSDQDLELLRQELGIDDAG